MAQYKIVMVGDPAVGKTAIVGRLLGGDFDSNYQATVGATFLTIQKEIHGEPCNMNLWDTAGQEVFRSLLSMYARDAQGALLVFDVTKTSSFESLDTWVKFVKDAAPNAKIIILANKIDLDTQREISQKMVNEYADKHGFSAYETSAHDGIGYDDAFMRLCELVYDAEHGTQIPAKERVDINDSNNDEKKTCC